MALVFMLALMALLALLLLPLALLALRALILMALMALSLLALMALLLALMALIRPLLNMALMALLLVMSTAILILLPRPLLSRLTLLPSSLLLLHRLLLSRLMSRLLLLLLARLLSRLLLTRLLLLLLLLPLLLLLLSNPRKHPDCLKLPLKQDDLRLDVFDDSKGVIVNRVMPRLTLPECTLVVLPCLPELQLSCLNSLAKGWNRLLQLTHVLEHSLHKKRDMLKPGPGRASLPNNLADSLRSRCDVRTLLGSRREHFLRDAEANILVAFTLVRIQEPLKGLLNIH